jgi:hypothetical protein
MKIFPILTAIINILLNVTPAIAGLNCETPVGSHLASCRGCGWVRQEVTNSTYSCFCNDIKGNANRSTYVMTTCIAKLKNNNGHLEVEY